MTSDSGLQGSLCDEFDFSQAAIYVDLSGNIMDVNAETEALFGFLRRDLLTKNIKDLFPDDFQDIYQALNIGAVFRNPYIESLNARLLNSFDSDANSLMVGVSFLFLPHEDYQEKIAVLLLRDQTEQVKNRQAKALAEEMLYEAIETIPDGFVIYDQLDRLFICNNAYLETYKTSAPAIRVGATFESIIRYGLDRGQYPQAGETDEARETWLAERLERHRNPSRTVVQQTDNGVWLKIDERVTRSGLIVGVRTDITELKVAEQKLIDNQGLLEKQKRDLEELAQQYFDEKEKAEAASKAKSEFSAIISHELRTPLTGIMGITDLLLASELSDEHRRYIEGLKSSSNNLLLLLNDILDYSKFEAEQISLEPMVFDFNRLLENLVVSLTPSARDRGISLRFEAVPETPNTVICGDKTKIRQILLNFSTNALKFTHEGNVVLRLISKDSGADKVTVRVEVQDSGIGISQTHKDKLFKPFTQGDSSTTRKYGGTGLGLAICKKLVEAMDGEGSVFWFEADFPKCTKEDLPSQEETLSVLKEKSELDCEKGIRLLLAEDNTVNRKVITTVLRKMGYSVDEAVNGIEAYNKARAFKYDLVLMDMQMPEMDGCDATVKIRALPGEHSTIPVIALTADVKAEQNERYRNAGINAFVSKPVDWIQLEDAIQKYVQ